MPTDLSAQTDDSSRRPVSSLAPGAAPVAGATLLSEQPLGGAHYRVVALCFAAWIFDFYDLILYSFLLVPIARDIHLSRTDSSLALGLSLAMTAVGGTIFGFVGDRFGRKPTIIASVLTYGVGTTLCALSATLPQLLIYRSITGLGIGGEWSAGQSMIAESMPPMRRARYAAYVQVGAPLGGLMAACADWFLEPAIGWRSVFLLSAAPAFIVAIAVWRWLPESDVWLARGTHRWINRDDLRALVPYRALIATLFIVLLINSEAYWFIYSWMPGYLRLVRGLPLRVSDRLIVGMQIGAVAGYAIFGALADRFGRRPVFCTYAMLMAVGLLPPTVLWSYAAPTPGLIAGAMVVVGFGTGVWSGVGPMISEMLPTAVRNTSLALLLNGTRGLQFFTPLAITAMSPRIGFGPTIAFGALFAAAGAASVWALPETRGRRITTLDTAQPQL